MKLEKRHCRNTPISYNNYSLSNNMIHIKVDKGNEYNSKLTRNSKKSWLAEAPVINRQDGMFGKGRNKIDAVVN